ncbi:unnamed protein product [Trichobilharzia regenti]|nr:unnamed protein product [Trichobilharzia regenti]
MDEHPHSCTEHKCLHQSTFQNLDEMDFERGIWSAAVRGDILRIKKLVARHIDVNILDKYGYTALTKSDGATPAHRAAYTGRLNILQLLVDKGGVALLEFGDGVPWKSAECNKLDIGKLSSSFHNGRQQRYSTHLFST